jgi:hypothetical protein
MKRPKEHETDSAGQRLRRGVFESLGWTVNKIENDYGADFEVEMFQDGVSTGATFKVQLKSSNSTQYSADGARISQPVRVANARYLANELRTPAVLIHCDVGNQRVFWSTPQLDGDFVRRLETLRTMRPSRCICQPRTNFHSQQLLS